MPAVATTWIQPSSSDPGAAAGFGATWAQSDTGNVYYRNTSNTGWVFAFNSNQINMGLVPVTGATMAGALLGAHGLMPLSGGDFSVAPTITGNPIATTSYVDSQIATLSSSITTQTATAIAQIPGLSVGSKIAVGFGVSGSLSNGGTFTIPLPVYGDGTSAVQSEVTGRYGAWAATFLGADGVVNAATTSVVVTETVANSRTFSITSSNSQTAPPGTGYIIGYAIIGIKKT